MWPSWLESSWVMVEKPDALNQNLHVIIFIWKNLYWLIINWLCIKYIFQKSHMFGIKYGETKRYDVFRQNNTWMNFFRFFQRLVSLKNVKKRIRIICDYSSNIADRKLKIWQKLLQIKCFRIVNTNFDFVFEAVFICLPD